MNIFNHIFSGAARAAGSWKWILVTWLVTLVLVSTLVFPFRSGLQEILGSSMITEKLKNGLDIDVLSNNGTGLNILRSFLASGIIFIILASWLLNIFLSGGFFNVLMRKGSETASRGFFGAAGSNFWSFFVVSLLVRLMLNLFSFLLIGLPLIILTGAGGGGNVTGTLMVTGSIFLVILPVFLLIADYARAWQASMQKRDAIRALGNGFRYTFRYFFSSWVMMFILIVLQVLFTFLVFKLISSMKPASPAGVFFLFILSQLFFIVKLYLRTWRYGMITSKFEAHS